MITPKFELSQSESHVVVEIHAPFVKAGDVEWYTGSSEFKFHVAPYFLRLTFEQELDQEAEAEGSYDADAGLFKIKIRKKHCGQHFDNLDLHNRLLASSRQTIRARPNIEVVSSSVENADEDTGSRLLCIVLFSFFCS